MHHDELLTRLEAVDTTCLVDAARGSLAVLPTDLRPVGRTSRMVGRAVTADARADLMSTIAGIQACGPGDVLVVASGDPSRAAGGELFATELVRRGAAGVVYDGCCRDSAVVAGLALPVFARGMAPHTFPAVKVPRIQVPIVVGDVEVRPGDLVVGDDDGLLVGSREAFAGAVERAEAIQALEQGLRAAIEAGSSLFDELNFDEHAAALAAGTESRLAFRDIAAGSQP